MSVAGLDSLVLRDIGARIIQHYWRQHRQRRPRTPATAAAPPPAPPPPAANASANPPSSVLDFMPAQPRPASSGSRPPSRPPRPRTTAGKPAAGAAAAKPPLPPRKPVHNDGSGSSADSTPDGAKPLPLEDSAERMNRKAAAAGAPAPTAVAAGAAALTRPPGQPSSQPQLDVRASASSEKLGSIMRMIERLEAQAVEEARQVAPACPPRPPALPASSGPAPASGEAAGQPAAPAEQHGQQKSALSRLLAAQPLSISSKRLAAAAATDAAAATALQAANASRVVRRSAELLTCAATPVNAGPACSAGSAVAPPSAATAPPAQPLSAAVAPASNATAQPAAATQPVLPLPGTVGSGLNPAAVASTVHAKIQALQAAVGERDGQLEELKRQVAAHRAQHEAALRAVDEGHRVGGLLWGCCMPVAGGCSRAYGCRLRACLSMEM